MSPEITGSGAEIIKPADCHVVAIIGARGGSKSLAGKNIRPLAGKPLLAWSIEAAKNCPLVDRVIVSTDDDMIAEKALAFGAEVPFRRPARLSGDDVPSIDYLIHAVDWLETEDSYRVDIVAYLQVTDVFRKKFMLAETVSRLIANPELDSVFVGYPTHKNFWKREAGGYRRAMELDDKPRQVKEPLFREDIGLACASRVGIIKSGLRIGQRVDIVVNHDFCSAVDIHDEFDLWLAEKIIAEGRRTIND